MLFAKVVLGLPVEGPFDYIVPKNLEKKINPGIRVEVNFSHRKIIGYVVDLSKETSIKNLKKILKVIDSEPVLDKVLLSLTHEISDYYCCSWGEAIETVLPEPLRKGKTIPKFKDLQISANTQENKLKNPDNEFILIHDLDGKKRWDMYLEHIKYALQNNKSVIILLPDKNSVLNAKNFIQSRFDVPLGILFRKKPKELEDWLKIKSGIVNIVIGSRSGIFAPIKNLGLIIIEEEENSIYKQDQVPHYHAREVAFMRSKLEKAGLILGSMTPSLESFYLSEKQKIKYPVTSGIKDFPEVKIIDMKSGQFAPDRRKIVFSKYLIDTIASALNLGGKVLLFLNRKGFATYSFCINCGMVIKCPRCNINLVYHFKDNILSCHYCNFNMELPKICPNCNSGYIKFTGAGTEKIESELSRIFVKARIERYDLKKRPSPDEADIFIATSAIIRQSDFYFELVGVLDIDNSLNRIDFRSSEKTFEILVGLLKLAKERLLIQTRIPNHHCFHALLKKDIDWFYKEELKQRKELNFPPYKHIILIKLRGKKEDRVRQLSHKVFERLKENKIKFIKILSVHPGQPSKLRDNFYWQILIKTHNVKKATAFLKSSLKGLSSSGIILTVDVDPV
jgi:primosomal protein N' (replication factor Y)